MRQPPTRAHRRRAALRAAALVVAVALVAAGCSHDDSSTPTPAPAPAVPTPTTMQVALQSLTGVRTAAPTVVGAAFVNTTGSTRSAAFTLSDLPDGTTIASVSPAAGQGQTGPAWSCSGQTCQLVDPTGAASQVTANDGVEALIALDTPEGTDPTASISLAVDGGAPHSAALSLPDGQPALPAAALSVNLGGPPTVLVGTTATADLVITNLAATSTAPGTTVTVAAPTIDGVAFSVAGSGWACQQLTCTLAAPIRASSLAPTLAVTVDATAATTGGSGTIGTTAQSSVAGAPLTDAASLDLTVRPPRSTGVSTRLRANPASTPAGGQVDAEVSLTATGQGTLSDPVSFVLDLPEGVTAQWDDVDVPGWTCTSSSASCETPGPLTAGQPVVVPVPLSVSPDAPRVNAPLQVTATVGTGGAAKAQKPSTASIVIVPPPVAELRATMALPTASPTGSTGSTGSSPTATTGGPIVFAAGQPRAVAVAVTNQGSAPTLDGATIHVEASPDSSQRLTATGADGWRCDAGAGEEISADHPLRCDQQLVQPLAPGATVSLPLTFAATAPSTVTWTVGAGLDGEHAAAHPSTARIQTILDQALLVTDVVADSPLYQGGSGEVSVVTGNHGTQAAEGATVVIAVPRGADVDAVYAPQWTCLDATFAGAAGTVVCTLTGVVEPGTLAPRITLDVTPTPGTRSLTFSAWGGATGEYLTADSTRGHSVELPVAGSLHVDAGQDLTVVTPQTGADGTPQPAVIVLAGDADLASARDLTWTQLCTQAGGQGCDGVSPAVAWVGVAPGADPTTPTARFTAPTITTPVDLRFQLSGQVGSQAITDDVTVHLLPAAIGSLVAPSAASAAGGTSTGSTGTSSTGNGMGGGGSPTTTAAPAPPTATVATAGSALQVPTEATGQLVGAGTGSGALTYAWTQTSGPSAAVEGASASQSTLLFTAPLLTPDEDGTALTFELTVTDATGATATATADVQVVWGDDGLQVTLADGAPDVVGTVGAPLTVTSSVASRGAPYTYSWSVDDITLPEGTATDDPTLQFTAGDQPADGTATLEVTDSFGRQTTVSVPVVVSGLPAGQLPAAFCSAVAGLAGGKPARLSGSGVGVTIPAATLSGAPATPCSASTIASFTDATATLPGGVSISGISGRLTVAGVQLGSGTVAVPANWALTGPAIGAEGLLVPFVSSSAVAVPSGTITGSGLPLLGAGGWSGTTTITFSTSPGPVAELVAGGSGPAAGSNVQLTGTADGDGTSLTMAADGLVAIGPVDLPVTGTLSTTSAAGPTTFATSATIGGPQAVGASTTLTTASLAWTPTGVAGPITLAIGAGSGALTLAGRATVTATGTSIDVAPGATTWSPTPGAQLSLSGTGAVTADQLTLSLGSAPVGPVPIGRDLQLSGLTASLTAACPLDGSQACAPQLSLDAQADSALFPAPVTVSGTAGAGSPTTTLAATGPTTATIGPMQVTGATLTVVLGSGLTPTATATGATSLLGGTPSVSVSFTDDTTLAQAPIGTQAIATGWTIEDTMALATTAPTTWSPPSGTLPGPTSTAVGPGQIHAVGVTQLPGSVTDGALPADVTSALASTTTSASAAALSGPFTLDAPIPAPWYVAGDAGSAVAATIDSVTFTVTPTDTATTIGVTGTGTLLSQDLDGTAGPSVPLTITTGQLGASPSGPVLDATLVATTPWTDVLGAQGLDAARTTLAVAVTGGTSTASLTASVALPAALAVPLGLPTGATPTLTTTFGSSDVCASIDLASGGGTGVDFGGAGLVVATRAYLVLAPEGCTTNGLAVPSGMTLLLDGTYLGLTQAGPPASASLAVDPATFAIDDVIDGVSATIGGLTLTGGTISVTTTGGTTAIDVTGSADVDGTSLTFSGPVAMPTTPGLPGTLALQATDPSLTIGETTADGTTMAVSDATVTVSGPSVVGATSGSVEVTGTTSLLGVDTAVDVTGTLTSGTIGQLAQALPTTTYPLWSPGGNGSGDTLQAAFAIAYDSTSQPSLTIAATNATLTTPTQTFPGTGVTVSGGSDLALTTSVAYLADGLVVVDGPMVALEGTYTYSGPGAGAYSLSNPSQVASTLAGVGQQATVSFERTFDGTTPTESGSQTSQLSLGVFDTDSPVVVSGPLSTLSPVSTQTLSTPADQPVQASLRGLDGSLSVQVQQSSLSSAVFDWYEIDTDLTTSTGDCLLWEGNPTFDGSVYRTDGTSYYTLTGQASPILPFGVAALGGSQDQPILLTNEVLPGSNIPANAISLNFPVQGDIYSADAQVTFGLSDCSYSLGGSATITIDGGSAAASLTNALTPPAGLTTSLNDLFGPAGELPANVLLERSRLEWQAMVGNLQTAMTQAQQEQQSAATAATSRYSDLLAAQDEVTAAQSQVATAQQAYDDAVDRLAAPTEAAQFADDFPLVENEIGDAQAALTAATAQVTQAQADLDQANARSSAATQDVARVTGQLTDANTALENATDAANDATQEANDASQAQVLQVTVDLTYCKTCAQDFSATFDGELYYGAIWVAELDASVAYGPSDATVQVTVGVGPEFMHSYGIGPVGFTLDAQAMISISVGHTTDGGWIDLSADLSASAQVDAWISVWGFTATADLVSISINGQVTFLPSVSESGSFSFEIFGYSINDTWISA